MIWQEFIASDKNVLMGKPSIVGTRLSVDFVIGLLAQGWSEEQILENYPRLKKEHFIAVFAYLHDCIRDGLLYSQTIKTT